MSVQIGSTPIEIYGSEQTKTYLTAYGDTVYYGFTNAVSSVDSAGSLTNGVAFAHERTRWFVCAPAIADGAILRPGVARVEIAERDELEERLDALEGNVGIEGPAFVATIADLPEAPAEGTHPMYLVLSVAPLSRPGLYAWDGQVWMPLGGGSGGGGGVGPGGTVQRNLFVQATRPEVGDIFLDSLWIKTVAGVPDDMAEWEVYTGTGDGDGGNLILSEDQPAPAVDALWIPLNDDGTPFPHTEWVVFTGNGSSVGTGNDNLYIQPTLPSNPVTGALYIPLDSGGDARSMELWRVNT